MSGHSRETYPPASYELAQRISVASEIFAQRRKQIQQQHGTLYRSGQDPAMWLPFHSNELSVLPLQIPQVFSGAMVLKNDPPERLPSMFSDLQMRDLPGLIVTTALVYSDFITSLYDVEDASLIDKKMRAYADTFSERDKDIAHAAVASVSTVAEEGAPRIFRPVDPESPYAIQSTIFADTVLSYPSQRKAIPFGLLVCLERLIKADEPILLENGERPRTLEEALDRHTTYDKNVLRNRLREMYEYFYAEERTEDLQLPSSYPLYPHYEMNKRYFAKNLLPLLTADDEDIDFATMYRDADAFAHTLEGGLS